MAEHFELESVDGLHEENLFYVNVCFWIDQVLWTVLRDRLMARVPSAGLKPHQTRKLLKRINKKDQLRI